MLYLTSAILRQNNAQAIQILAMAEAFGRLLGNDFLLVSPRVDGVSGDSFNWRQTQLRFEKRQFRYPEFALRNLRAHKGFKGDWVFTRDIGLAFVMHYQGAKVVYEVHKDFRTKVGYHLFNLLRNKIRYVTISKVLKSYIASEHSIDQELIHVAHDGVFLEGYDAYRDTPKAELRKELGLPQDKTLFMHTGSLYEGRGLELFEPVLDNFPDVMCVSVGGRPDDILRWKASLDRYPNVMFVEHQSRESIIKYQMAADLLFFPMTKGTSTWWCCSPLKIFEYMASGTPILGSNLGSTTEVFNEANGITFDPERPEEVAKGVKSFLDNPQQAQSKAELALNHIASSYTWEARAKGILEFLEKR